MAKEIVKRETTALANWEAEMAEEAKQEAGRIKVPTGNFISVRAGVLNVAGQPVKGNELNVVILDSIYENQFYEEDYDPENPSSPVCYAFGHTVDELSPHDDAVKKQHDECSSCPQNEWGSAEKGKGKACKNVRRLAIISADALREPKSILDTEIFYLKVPVTSTKGFDLYARGVEANYVAPVHGMVTKIAPVPDAKSQFKITFAPVEKVNGEQWGYIKERRKSVVEQISFPYQKPVQLAAPQERKKRKYDR